MDQEKIGKLIAECRKKKNLTQARLAEQLGVTDKSVSKWENGICLPDVSLYKSLCEILGITLNEFFAGKKLSDETFKETADNNLLNALENSAFILKDRITFFEKKWEKDHLSGIIINILIVAGIIIYGFIKDNNMQYLGMALGFISTLIENNRKASYVEKNAYGKKSNISVDEFQNYLKTLKEFKEKMNKFANKKDAINYLMKETHLPKQDCQNAYDIIMKIDFEKINKFS